jgi:hypothetical protein
VGYKTKEAKAEWDYDNRKLIRTAWIRILSYRYTLQCSKCGYNKNFAALDFHHVDPLMKDKDVKVWHCINMVPMPELIEVVCSELDKCIVLCATCHREEHHTASENYLP